MQACRSPFLFSKEKRKVSQENTGCFPVCLRKPKMIFFGLAKKKREWQFAYGKLPKPIASQLVVSLS